ncbi:hypothetical protein [uncultured Paraglaciecola sp.]|uniref:hypothetical protein n=1 Tax=uncultured Paraglaciecola sp. TaxID=1765024 RepID=UPI002612775F|nr:hypothetical protein [uncultured Paraglaciecola sp.]
MALTKYTGNKPQRNIRATFSNYMDAWITWFLDVFMQEIDGVVDALNLNNVSDTSASSISINLTTGKTAAVSSGKGFLPGGYLIFADAAAPAANSMVVQVVSYVGTTLTFDPVTTKGSGTKTSWVISFSAQPQLTVGDHEIYMTTPNGYGSTDLNIRGYSVTQRSVGTAISHAYTAANGSVFTINENGKYDIQFADQANASNENIGISVNSSELTTNIKIINAADRISLLNNISETSSSHCSALGVTLSVGDKVRIHTNRNSAAGDVTGWMRIVKKQAL